MKVEWMNHTGLSVSNMDRSLEFYRDTLGLEIERDSILEGDTPVYWASRTQGTHRLFG